MSRVTQQQIADAFSVSRMTVSLALRNSPRVSKSLRKQIQEHAEALGYVSDPALRELARRRFKKGSAQSGYRIIYLHDNPFPEAYHDRHRKIFHSESRRLGYLMDLVSLASIRNLRSTAERWSKAGVRGVVINDILDSEVHAEISAVFAAVATGACPLFPPLNVVLPDHYGAARESIARLIELGFRRIAVLLEKKPGGDWHQQYINAGLSIAQRVAPGTRVFQIVLATPDEARARSAAFQRWFKRTRPEVFLCQYSNGPYILRAGMESASFPTPSLPIACLDVQRKLTDNLTGMTHRAGETARMAMQMLENLIAEWRVGLPSIRRVVMLQSHWHYGASLSKEDPGMGIDWSELTRKMTHTTTDKKEGSP